jgi:hypothetical protein
MHMSNVTKIPVRVVGPNKELSQGEVSLETWDQSERLKRALKTLGLGWVISICVVPVPLVHLIGAIAFLLTPFFAYHIYSTKTVVEGGTAECPRCHSVLPIAKTKDTWPLTDLCTKCSSNVTIEKANESAQ